MLMRLCGRRMAGELRVFAVIEFELMFCRYYFLASGSTLNIHAAVAPDYHHVSTLPSPTSVQDGHTAQIISYALNPTNPLQVLTASEDGFIKVWDWTDGRLIRSINLAAAMAQEDVTREYKKAKKNKEAADKGEKEEKGRRVITQMTVGIVGGKGYIYATTGFPADHDSPGMFAYPFHDSMLIPCSSLPSARSHSTAHPFEHQRRQLYQRPVLDPQCQQESSETRCLPSSADGARVVAERNIPSRHCR